MESKRKAGWRIIGKIGVDAGLCWIGDPCYVMGRDASSAVNQWSDFCDKLDAAGHDERGFSTPLGKGTGVAVLTGYGDGVYPVAARFNCEGRPVEIRVLFDAPEVGDPLRSLWKGFDDEIDVEDDE